MMRNLFNNPWFIGALGAFATLYLGITLVGPIFNKTDNVANDDPVPPLGLSIFDSEDDSEKTDNPDVDAESVNRELAVDKRGETAFSLARERGVTDVADR